jgi:hypothetical protein
MNIYFYATLKLHFILPLPLYYNFQFPSRLARTLLALAMSSPSTPASAATQPLSQFVQFQQPVPTKTPLNIDEEPSTANFRNVHELPYSVS